MTKLNFPPKTAKIDFDFMESFIAELEVSEYGAIRKSKRIRQYELSADEVDAL